MTTPATPTLTTFLEDTGATLRFYDMGRRVTPLARDTFLAFEQTELPYPFPLQQKAWFSLIQTHPDEEEPLIWFLRLDLDEQGKLVQATRDYLIHRFLEIAAEPSHSERLGEAMRDNPCAFAPREDKMANLHAVVQRDLGRPASRYFAHARDYLAGRLGWEQWTFIGYQGLADLAARQQESGHASLLAEAIPRLPDEPLIALCHCLENHPPHPALQEALLARLEQALAAPESRAPLLAALLRGLARAERPALTQGVLTVLADGRATDPEVLAAIGGRAWEALEDPMVARGYLERLASTAVDQDIFNHCVSDLLRMPGLRSPILEALRAEDRSESLAGAFQRLLD